MPAARCASGQLEDGGWYVEDDGPGIAGEPADIARLFSIRRPLVSSKLLRLPTRGALGNGLRVVAGAVLASGGRLVAGDPRAQARSAAAGQRRYAGRGRAVRAHHRHPDRDPAGRRTERLRCAGVGEERCRARRAAARSIEAARRRTGTTARRSSICSRRPGAAACASWWPSSTAAPAPRQAGSPPAFKGRACSSLSRAEANDLLEAAQRQARPVSPSRLGHVGEVEGWPPFHARGEGTFRCGGIGGPRATIPFVVEAWASAERDAYGNSCSVLVNRTPITGTVSLSRWQRDLTLNGCGLASTLRAAPGRSGIDLRINIITPYMPITSDGKAPNLSCCSEVIREVAGKAVRRALRAEPPEPKSKRSQKEVVLAHLDAAIAKASGHGAYRFSPRQVFYVIRPIVREAVGAELQWGNFETIIGDHELEQGEIAGMYRDPRGTLYHPHRQDSIPLGTLQVERYRRPEWTFNKILFIEKEGFFEALKEDGLAGAARLRPAHLQGPADPGGTGSARPAGRDRRGHPVLRGARRRCRRHADLPVAAGGDQSPAGTQGPGDQPRAGAGGGAGDGPRGRGRRRRRAPQAGGGLRACRLAGLAAAPPGRAERDDHAAVHRAGWTTRWRRSATASWCRRQGCSRTT